MNRMTTLFNTRYYFLSVVLVCLGLLGFGLYLEHVRDMEPCPLCVFQRMAFIGILGIALAATIHGPRHWGRYLYNGLLLVAALIGVGIAARQVWLQHLPADKVPECGPGLDYILEVFPLTEALGMILSGSGECAEVQWQFLGMSIAEWSLLWFLAFAVLALVSIFTAKQAIR